MVRAWLIGLAAWMAGPAAAQECRLALLLALDVSSSVDAREYDLQKDGMAAAMLAPEVVAAFVAGAPVALAAYEWSGRRQSAVVLDWVLIRSEGDVAAAARAISGAKRSQTRFPTAMGYALGYGATMLRRAPDCARKVIDVSGDGVSNDGFGPRLAYRHFPFDGVVVNALAVLGADAGVESYFRDVVRFGPGAFVETAKGYRGYASAMARKLLRELGGMQVGAVR